MCNAMERTTSLENSRFRIWTNDLWNTIQSQNRELTNWTKIRIGILTRPNDIFQPNHLFYTSELFTCGIKNTIHTKEYFYLQVMKGGRKRERSLSFRFRAETTSYQERLNRFCYGKSELLMFFLPLTWRGPKWLLNFWPAGMEARIEWSKPPLTSQYGLVTSRTWILGWRVK